MNMPGTWLAANSKRWPSTDYTVYAINCDPQDIDVLSDVAIRVRWPKVATCMQMTITL